MAFLKKKNLINILILLMYVLNIDFNVLLYTTEIVDSALNKDLYNGLLIIHPILTYVTVVLYVSIFTIFINTIINTKFSKKFKYKKKLYNCIAISFLSLLLGSI
jgi:cytochrome c biogenesis factor